MNANQVLITHAKKKTRGELRLPQLHFVAADDWLKKLGKHAFCAWLQLYSWADRSDANREYDQVPTTMNALAKKLDVAKATFWNKIIRPLWNYGLIDLIETEYTGYSIVNIIVYEYPQNDPALATKELVKIRDYDNDYKSTAREKSLKISDRKEEEKKEQFENQTGTVQKMNRGGGSKNEPEPSSKNEPGAVQILNHNNVLEVNNDLEYITTTKENVVVVDPIQQFAKQHGISIPVGTLKKWRKRTDDETILRYLRYSMTKAEKPLALVNDAITNGYDPTQNESGSKKVRSEYLEKLRRAGAR
jgi:hypothetical protein